MEGAGFVGVEAEVRVTTGRRAHRDFAIGAAVPVNGTARVIGSRAPHGAPDELAVAVDFHPARRIAESAQVEMAAALNELAPSVYFPRRQGADLTSGVRPFQLRGLSPDHTLVLVNGKRHHATAVVHTSGGGAFPGSSGVDMNAFPLQALGRMEILRDAAAAQYGSDAIAGVINLRLRNTVQAPEFVASVGHHFPDEWDDDGSRYDLSGHWGIAIGPRGVLNLTGGLTQRDPTNRAGADPRDQIVPGDADFVDHGSVIRKNNEVPQPTHRWGDGESTGRMFLANFELPLGDAPDAAQLYAFGGFSKRRERHSDLYVRSMDDRNWPQIHPFGFLPTFDSDTRDLFGVAGVRGTERGWELGRERAIRLEPRRHRPLRHAQPFPRSLSRGRVRAPRRRYLRDTRRPRDTEQDAVLRRLARERPVPGEHRRVAAARSGARGRRRHARARSLVPARPLSGDRW